MLKGSFEAAGYMLLRVVATLLILAGGLTYVLVGWFGDGRHWLANARDMVADSLHNVWWEE